MNIPTTPPDVSAPRKVLFIALAHASWAFARLAYRTIGIS